MSNNLFQASREWATRPNDERFLSLVDLREAVASRKVDSWTAAPQVKNLRAVVTDSNSVGVQVFDPTAGEVRTLMPTHHGFGQVAQIAGAPAAYLRKLDPTLAAINLQFGLEKLKTRDDALVLGQASEGLDTLRAVTSTSYGRIWDLEVVNAVERVAEGGNWQIPAASYATTNPKRATTLYAGDRNVFIFLVDPTHPIEVGEEVLFRGFYVWNSEVGAATFGVTTFLYRYICDNRIIWGAQEVRELTMRHTSGAPERFKYEGAKYLNAYAESSTAKTVEVIERAQTFEIPKASEKDGVEKWLQERGFTAALAKASVAVARAEEGEARSLWDIVQGVTAHARSIPNADDRIDVEKQGSKLLSLVSGR